MNPTRRIATILTVAAVTLAGAGFALASVGGTTTTDAEAAAPASTEANTDPAAVRALTRQLSQLDSRSNKLRKLLDDIRGKSQQVSESTVIARTTSEETVERVVFESHTAALKADGTAAAGEPLRRLLLVRGAVHHPASGVAGRAGERRLHVEDAALQRTPVSRRSASSSGPARSSSAKQ